MRYSLIFVLILGLFIGCQQNEGKAPSDMVVTAEFIPNPAKVGPQTVDLKFTDSEGKPLEVSLIGVEGNMSHPGMVPSIGKFQEKAVGEFQVTLDLTMPGDWILFLKMKQKAGEVISKELEFRVVE
jgi:hypothetical protein